MFEMRLVPGQGTGGRSIRIRMIAISPGWRPYLGLENFGNAEGFYEFRPVEDPREYRSSMEILSIRKVPDAGTLQLRLLNFFGIEKEFNLVEARIRGRPVPVNMDDMRALFFGSQAEFGLKRYL